MEAVPSSAVYEKSGRKAVTVYSFHPLARGAAPLSETAAIRGSNLGKVVLYGLEDTPRV